MQTNEQMQKKRMMMRTRTWIMPGVWVLAAGLLAPMGATAASGNGPDGVVGEAAKRPGATVTIKGPKTAPVAGDSVRLRGKAKARKKALARATVKLQYRSRTWVTLGRTQTDDKGRYVRKVNLPDSPQVKVRAMLVSPASVRGTVSTPITITPATAECRVRNKERTVATSGAGAVQAAVNKSAAGDKLTVTGTCTEHDITIDKNLTLKGPGTIDAAQQGRAIYNTATLTITGGLTVTGGDSTDSADNPGYGAGIANIGGTVNLKSGSITGNSAPFNGGGIYSNGGSVTIDGGRIIDNYGGIGGGGGIFSTGTVTLNKGAISGNNAYSGGGALVYGTMIMNGGTVSGNTSVGGGAGIYNYNIFTINGGTITGNGNPDDPDTGGGIFGISAVTTLNGGAITSNYGGGVYCDGGLSGNRSIVYNNTPFDIQC